MTPWHRFWFPDGDSRPSPTRDAALWTPQALAETQRAMWQHATQATEAWWRYWRAAWPSLPAQGPVGTVVPPSAPAPVRMPAEAHADAPPPTRRRKAATRTPAAHPTVNPPSRPRRAARGK